MYLEVIQGKKEAWVDWVGKSLQSSRSFLMTCYSQNPTNYQWNSTFLTQSFSLYMPIKPTTNKNHEINLQNWTNDHQHSGAKSVAQASITSVSARYCNSPNPSSYMLCMYVCMYYRQENLPALQPIWAVGALERITSDDSACTSPFTAAFLAAGWRRVCVNIVQRALR